MASLAADAETEIVTISLVDALCVLSTKVAVLVLVLLLLVLVTPFASRVLRFNLLAIDFHPDQTHMDATFCMLPQAIR